MARFGLGPAALSLLRALAGASLIGLFTLTACSRRDAPAEGDAGDSLPELRFDDATPGLLLTWLDPQGGAHVETRPADVPADARGFVRVVVSESDRGVRDPIYVSDLGKQDPSGYVARSMPRRLWEDEIDRRRSRDRVAADGASDDARRTPPPPGRGGPGAAPPPRAPGEERPSTGPRDPELANVVVVVYGASWCKPCHEALDHLERRGVKAVFKDIEADPGAASEMQSKLQRGGQRRGSIPVIDVSGQILVGFSARAIDLALPRAAGGTAL